MTIIVQSPSSVLVDKQHYGAVADAIANNKELASDIQRALVVWSDAKDADAKTALDAALTRATTAEKSLTELQAIQADLVKRAKEGLEKAKDGDISHLEALVVEAEMPQLEKRKAELQAVVDKAQADLKALES